MHAVWKLVFKVEHFIYRRVILVNFLFSAIILLRKDVAEFSAVLTARMAIGH
ncbi:hypothetical protein CCACVL1_30724 [Corchorus capsularis]|uniref:Uncharacterized protein n=1 Tax=Corchorus capsularis TaxID=210143 RepID=A0A1R3FVW5_COCAP|nr:hypothetical protein CCACVL1_30724 [Corchorus capsularis]